MANECRSVCGVAALAIPACRSAARIARCTLWSSAWWRRTAPERGSTDRFPAGNTYCHAHSRAACGYLRASANGRLTSPNPARRSSSCSAFTRARCARSISASSKLSATRSARDFFMFCCIQPRSPPAQKLAAGAGEHHEAPRAHLVVVGSLRAGGQQFLDQRAGDRIRLDFADGGAGVEGGEGIHVTMKDCGGRSAVSGRRVALSQPSRPGARRPAWKQASGWPASARTRTGVPGRRLRVCGCRLCSSRPEGRRTR